jgi:hypothetical protein
VSKWIRQTFSDGEKPSLARQLIAIVVLIVLLLLTAHAFAPKKIGAPDSGMLDKVLNLLESLMMWAGWSRGVTAIRDVKGKISAAPAVAPAKPPAVDPDAGP